jgi:DNA repair photolyase
VDAWAPEAQKYNLGRRCLGAILNQPGWKVRILTKNAAISKDLDFVERYKDRILLGLSITATKDKTDIMSIIEPAASLISERMDVMKEAHRRGLRTYAMFCPLLPGIADSPEQIDELVSFAVDCGVEEIFIEPVNSRGPGLKMSQQALTDKGYKDEAAAIESIRKKIGWSQYTTRLISNVQRSVRKLYDVSCLRFLLYPSRLTKEDISQIKQDDVGVIWLGRV